MGTNGLEGNGLGGNGLGGNGQGLGCRGGIVDCRHNTRALVTPKDRRRLSAMTLLYPKRNLVTEPIAETCRTSEPRRNY